MLLWETWPSGENHVGTATRGRTTSLHHRENETAIHEPVIRWPSRSNVGRQCEFPAGALGAAMLRINGTRMVATTKAIMMARKASA